MSVSAQRIAQAWIRSADLQWPTGVDSHSVLIYGLMLECGHADELCKIPLSAAEPHLLGPLSDQLQANGDRLGLYIAHWLAGSLELVSEAASKLDKFTSLRMQRKMCGGSFSGGCLILSGICDIDSRSVATLSIGSRIAIRPRAVRLDSFSTELGTDGQQVFGQVVVRNIGYGTLASGRQVADVDWPAIVPDQSLDIRIHNVSGAHVRVSATVWGDVFGML